MSVAPLTAQEIATFAAICHKLQLVPYDALLPLCQLVTAGNCGAWAATYEDRIEPATAEELERELLGALADETRLVRQSFGPCAYNMVANNGEAFSSVFGSPLGDTAILEKVHDLEEAAKKWQDAQRRTLERQEENAVAFNEVGQLPTATRSEIAAKCAAAGAERVIIATFGVDESDMMTDYHGGRTGRRVVIGFGKGKRENFKQLRAAAAKFPPTAHLGTGKDEYTALVVFTNDCHYNGSAYWKGSYSHWHSDIGHGTEFQTEAAAAAFIAAAGAPHDLGMGDQIATFEWHIRRESVEQRENYSMGGGNYLGRSRYGGWSVSSCQPAHGENRMEIFGS